MDYSSRVIAAKNADHVMADRRWNAEEIRAAVICLREMARYRSVSDWRASRLQQPLPEANLYHTRSDYVRLFGVLVLVVSMVLAVGVVVLVLALAVRVPDAVQRGYPNELNCLFLSLKYYMTIIKDLRYNGHPRHVVTGKIIIIANVYVSSFLSVCLSCLSVFLSISTQFLLSAWCSLGYLVHISGI